MVSFSTIVDSVVKMAKKPLTTKRKQLTAKHTKQTQRTQSKYNEYLFFASLAERLSELCG
jgi:hypothetical protein